MRRLRRSDPGLEARWLGQVREVVSRVLAPFSVDLYLIGSRARGDSRLASDIDLAVDPRGDLPESVLAELHEALEESTVPVRVDLIDMRRAGEELRAKILKEGIRWIDSKSA